MDYRKKLFTYQKLYDLTSTDRYFVNAIKKNIFFHRKHCSDYNTLLSKRSFQIKQVKSIHDLDKIPFIPTLYLKTHKLRSMPKDKLLFKSTSSGTKGKKSQVGYDALGLYYGAYMVLRTAVYHKLLSLKPTNYIILGYKPDKNNHTIISKTAFGATFFAPAISRTYALKPSEEGYQLDLDGIKKALLRYSHQPFPVRLVGFPSYAYFFLEEMKRAGIKVKLHKDSMVLLGGGWKQFYQEAVDKRTLYALLDEVLGIKENHCKEFFGAAEHPIIYCDCEKHHFHVPIYSRIIIRDVDTLKPVKNGEVGLVNLLTPMLESMPLVSIMTDDLGILHDGAECGCGITSPYFEIIGRVGIKDIKTCAAGAAELLSK